MSQAPPSPLSDDPDDRKLVLWSMANVPAPIEAPDEESSVPAVPLSEDDVRRILAMALGAAPVGNPPRFLPPILDTGPPRQRSIRYRRVAVAVAVLLLAIVAALVVCRQVMRPRLGEREARDSGPANPNPGATRRADALPEGAREWVIDDDDPGFSTTGTGWTASRIGGYLGGHHYNNQGARSAFWTLERLPKGKYEIFVTWNHHENRAWEVPFRILDGAREIKTEILDQSVLPHDLTAHGVAWKRLGVFEITGKSLTVELDSTRSKARLSVPTGSACSADAILVRSVPPE